MYFNVHNEYNMCAISYHDKFIISLDIKDTEKSRERQKYGMYDVCILINWVYIFIWIYPFLCWKMK